MSFCSFSSLLPMKQLFSLQLSLPKTCIFFHSNELLSPEVLDLDPQVRSQKGPTKPKNRTNNAKEFSEKFEGVTGVKREGF